MRGRGREGEYQTKDEQSARKRRNSIPSARNMDFRDVWAERSHQAGSPQDTSGDQREAGNRCDRSGMSMCGESLVCQNTARIDDLMQLCE